MDDHKFEEFIKGKIGEYEDPDFDPAALADFQQRMAAISISPWYVRYATVLWVTSALIVFTVINFYIHWTVGNHDYQTMQREIVTLKAENHEIRKLTQELEVLKNTFQDTASTTEAGPMPLSSLSAPDNGMNNVFKKEELPGQEKLSFYVGSEETLPTKLLQQLQLAGFVRKDGKDIYLISASELMPLPPKSITTHAYSPHKPEVFFVQTNKGITTPTERKNREKVRLPAKTIRELEKHKQRGIGINAGPTLDIFKGIYEVGETSADLGGGIMGELVLSPSLSVESGVKYMFRNYHIDNATDLQSIELPEFDNNMVNIEKAKVTSHMLDFPVNLKYKYLLTPNIYGVFGAGYSAVLYLRQNFEYAYTFNTGSWDEDLFLSIDEEEKEVEFSAGMLNLSMGISGRLRNNHALELLMYYQHSLGKMGEEEITPNFFGIKSTYWWKIR